jgi:hypothetical protein
MNAQQASWTPDGRLVYRSPVNDLLDWYILDRPGTDHPAQFWLQTPVTSNPALFSPDDSRMALALDTFSNTGSYRIGIAALAQSGSLQLYTVEDRPGRVLQLHGWSGEYVLYSTRSSQSGVGDYEYGVLDTHTGTMTRITVADGRTVHDAAWRP